MKIKKISNRILVNFLGILVLTFVITMVIFSALSKQFIIDETKKDLLRVAVVIEKNYLKTTERLGDDETSNRLRTARLIADIETFDQYIQMETIVLDQDEDIVYPRKTWTIDRLKRVMKNIRLSETDYIYYRYNLKNEQMPIKSFVLLKRFEDVNPYRNTGIKAFIISFAIGGILAFLMSMMLSKRIYKPIQKMKASMLSYMHDRTPVEIYSSHDEIEELATGFKALTDRITALDNRQKKFFQNSSHELKTPLMSIQGYAEAIKDGVVKGEEINESLNIIISETQRLKHIVDDVIYLSKVENMAETLILEKLILKNLIEEAVDVTKPLLQNNGLEIQIACSDDVEIICDGDKIKRVFINLLSNGSRYAKTKMVINVHQNDELTTIDVIDDGPGFEFGQEELIFDRFYNGEKGGSGIGLALCKEIIEQHGGTILAINNMNYGAVFKIKFKNKKMP